MFTVGDTVRYNPRFITAIRGDNSLANMRGKVVELKKPLWLGHKEVRLVRVEWQVEDGYTSSVLPQNLQKI